MFGKAQDPTALWPAAGRWPALDLEGKAVGPLRLGDPFDAAKAVGRPDRLRHRARGGNQILEYQGFQLEFRNGLLICAAFDIEDGARLNVGDVSLSRATKPLDALGWFGEPSADSNDGDDLRWLDYERDGTTLALEFDADGLTCVQLYAEGYA